jgi:hypothetical protein
LWKVRISFKSSNASYGSMLKCFKTVLTATLTSWEAAWSWRSEFCWYCRLGCRGCSARRPEALRA